MFCPKCGSILKPKKADGKNVMACSCGHVNKNVKGILVEEVKKKSKGIEVVEKSEIETLPKTYAECPKCKHKTAYYWLVQTRAGDEAETKFLKCEKCKHTWREYD